MAQKYCGLNVVLISNASINKNLNWSDIELIDLESFYDPSHFNKGKKNIMLDHQFRDGFWLHTSERLFVLWEFMNKSGRKNILHAELDQLVFGVDALKANLDLFEKKGVFFPLHSKDKAVASLFYCNDLDAIESLVLEATMGASYLNEMQLLLNWGFKNPSQCLILPTLDDVRFSKSKLDKQYPFLLVDNNFLGGIVDAAELGLWVAGRDPRNLPLNIRPSTRFTYPEIDAALPQDYLANLIFELHPNDNYLKVTNLEIEEDFRIFNLHIQAKVHKWIARNHKNMSVLLNSVRQEKQFSIPGTRLTQLTYASGVIANRFKKEGLSYPMSKIRTFFLKFKKQF